MLKQQLHQKLQQKLSPHQIQLIKLLELPSVELEDRIKKELEENPALEEGKDTENFDLNDEDSNDFQQNNEIEDFSIEEYDTDDDIPDYKLNATNYSAENERHDIPVSLGISFHEHLIDQLRLHDFTEKEKFYAEYIIGNIDDEGYLERTPENICDDILFQTGENVDVAVMLEMLKRIQQFDPAGVGAQNLQECLLLQIERKKETDAVLLATTILHDYFDEFTKKHYDKIIKKLGISEQLFKEAVTEITKLNPKPGNSWTDMWEKSMEQITPDFILENTNTSLLLRLNNQHIPDLRINNSYSYMLQKYANDKKTSTDALLFIKQKVDAAKWFIEAIKQRQITLLSVMNAIIDFQKEYFQTGDESRLKPMIMKDIAHKTGYDISTISRVSNSKYIETDFGIFPLKHFFSEASQTNAGEEISTREIKSILAACIENEDKQHPFTDDVLSDLLKQKGYSVARRTVAKYREQLNIPVARLRKEMQ